MIWYCPVSSRSFSLRRPNSALSLSEAESVSVWVTVVPLQYCVNSGSMESPRVR